MNNKIFIIISALLILIVGALVILLNLLRQPTDPNNSTPTITDTPTPVIFPTDLPKGQSLQAVPTLNPVEGVGLDLNSEQIQNSTNEINKIKDKLPYNKSISSSGGLEVDIMIPSYELLDSEWTLMVHILPLDYQISETDPNFTKTKDAFRQAALDVFFWLKENGVDTEKIIIKWGDREYIQQRSVEWLK